MYVMKKLLLSIVTTLLSTTMIWAAEGGKLTASTDPIDPTQDVTLHYDGAGTNFANWEPSCFVHTWLVPKSGETFSKGYSTEWISCAGDAAYAAIDAKRKMTLISKGHYEMVINIKSFFGVADEDLTKIAKIGVIVCTQWVINGGNNQTIDLFAAVGEPLIASDKFSFNWGVQDQPGWQSVLFTNSNGDGNTFTTTVTVPDDFSTLSYFVGYNGGGIGDPVFVESRSETKLLSTMPGIASGQRVFTIYKDSQDKNWFISANGATAIQEHATAEGVYSCQGLVRADFEKATDVVIYTIGGQMVASIRQTRSLEQPLSTGLYIVKAGNQIQKVMVR